MVGLRINLGSGPEAPEGWVNIDRSPHILVQRSSLLQHLLHRMGILPSRRIETWPKEIVRRDIRRALPFASNSVEAIYSSHALEHLYLNEAISVLAECRRVLVAEGVLRLALPNAETWARELLAGAGDADPEPGMAFNTRLNMAPLERPTGRRKLTLAAGHNLHRWQPTLGLVRSMLANAGFTVVSECNFREGELPGLRDIEHRIESLFLEAHG